MRVGHPLSERTQRSTIPSKEIAIAPQEAGQLNLGPKTLG